MLHQLTTAQLGGGINLVDIGASGRPDPKWRPLQRRINYVGFEPNSAECARLAGLPSPFNSVRYMPYALAGENGAATLHCTRSLYCGSLLKPNRQWLERFSFAGLFEVTGMATVPTRRLADIEELQAIDVDAIKVDAQGVELPILAGAGRFLEDAFYVETETGLVQNYHGESTYAEVDQFMRSRGFLLFDLNAQHRVPRKNQFQDLPTGSEQILWCEAVWLKDYVTLCRASPPAALTREKALKALLLCGLQGCRDFGWELATLFHQQGLLAERELAALANPRGWRLESGGWRALPWAGLALAARLFSKRARRTAARTLEKSFDQPDLLKSFGRRWTRRRAA
jgi:FkbM family methyltransferase